MKALLVIDVQKGITDKNLYKKDAFFNTVNEAIDRYAINKDAVIFIMHENKFLIPKSSGWQLDKRLNLNNEYLCFYKTKGNAFMTDKLKDYLDSMKINEILVCGLVSHGCVKATCEGGTALGYNVSLLKNGHTNYHSQPETKIIETEDYLGRIGVALKEI